MLATLRAHLAIGIAVSVLLAANAARAEIPDSKVGALTDMAVLASDPSGEGSAVAAKFATETFRKVNHRLYLVQLKTPSESKAPCGFDKLVLTIPADRAFRPLKGGYCPTVTRT